MLKLIISLALLALSAFFNIKLYLEYQETVSLLRKCEDKYNRMLTSTYEKAEQLEKAKTDAMIQLHRADTYLLAPPAVEGDDCGSARIRIDNWLNERKADGQPKAVDGS